MAGRFGTKQMLPNPDMEFEPDQSMRRLARRIIQAYPQLFGHIELKRVLFYHETTGADSAYAGVCRPILPPYKSILARKGIDADWIIEFYSYHTQGKSSQWTTILMFHELIHITPEGERPVRHDVEDFSLVLHMAGVDWARGDRELPDILSKRIRNKFTGFNEV